jgi:hypothetical protein
MRLVVLCCLIVLAPGIAHAADDLDGAWEACQARIAATPEYRAVADKIGGHAVQAMMSSPDKATPQEAAQVRILHEDYLPRCRQIQREALRRHNPFLGHILEAAFAKSDANLTRLTTFQITWGQFTRDSEAIKADLSEGLRRAQIMFEVTPQGEPSRR